MSFLTNCTIGLPSKEKFSKTDVNSTLGRFENQQIVDMSF